MIYSNKLYPTVNLSDCNINLRLNMSQGNNIGKTSDIVWSPWKNVLNVTYSEDSASLQNILPFQQMKQRHQRAFKRVIKQQ